MFGPPAGGKYPFFLGSSSWTIFYYEHSKQKRASKIAFNNSSYIDFKDFINLYKKCTEKPYSFLMIDTLASDNPLRFRKNLLERI